MNLNQTSTGTRMGRVSRWRALLTGTALGCSLAVTGPAAAQAIDQTSEEDVEVSTPEAESIRARSTGANVAITAQRVVKGATSGSAVYGMADAGDVTMSLGTVSTGSNAVEARTPGGGDITIDVDTVDAGGRGIYTTSLFVSGEGFTSGDTVIRAGSVTAAGGNAIIGQGYSVLVDADYLSGSAIPTYASTLYVSAGEGGAIVDVRETVSQGDGQWGIDVSSVGDTVVTSGAVTARDGAFGMRGISVRTSADAAITSGSISTAGEGSYGIWVDGYTADPTSVLIDSGTVTTTGNYSTAIYTPGYGAGPVSIASDAITTSGTQAHGIVVAANPDPGYEFRPVSDTAGTGALTIASGTIDATGAGGRGIVVDHRGPISIGSGAINSDGSGVYMWAGGQVDIASGSVATAAGPGIVVYGGEGDVTLDSGTVTVGERGDAGIHVETTSGNIAISADSTTTTSVPILYGFTADGVVGFSQTGNVAIDSGAVSVAGEDAWGIAGSTAGTVSITSDEVTTTGVRGVGIYAGGSSGVTVDSGSVTTAGVDAFGIRARSLNGDVVVSSGSIATAGNGATGIFVPTSVEGGSLMGGAITIASGTITTAGDNATGITVGSVSSPAYGMREASGGTGAVSITSDTITTGGANSWGIAVDHVGPISITSNAIVTAGEGGGGAGILVWAGDKVDIDSGTIETPNGPGIVVYGAAGDVTIAADRTNVGEGSDVGVWARTTTGNISIVAGDTTTARRDVREGITADGVTGISAGGGDVSVQAGTTSVVGQYAWGVTAYTSGTASIVSGTVTTGGIEGVGVYGRGDIGGVTIESGSVTTSGEAAHGIAGWATEGDVAITSGSVSATGQGSNAIFANAQTGDIAVNVTGTHSAAQAAAAQLATGGKASVSVGADGSLAGSSGVVLAGTMQAAAVDNAGSIEGTSGYGIHLTAPGLATIANGADAEIVGSRSGVGVEGGSIDLVNAGLIRGDGIATSNSMPPEAGIRLQSGSNRIVNSGTISGAQYGIASSRIYNPQTQQTEWRLGTTEIANSGSIVGETDDGVLLYGGGTVVNSGTISGLAGDFADGVQLQGINPIDDGRAQIGSVVNAAGGTITGSRYGIIVAGGGTIDNAGTVSGGTTGVMLVNQFLPGRTGSLRNSGTINGGVLIHLDEGMIENSGTINGGIVAQGATQVFNTGAIAGDVTLSGFDDALVLGTGSTISGAVSGGDGFDLFALEGGGATLSNLQTVSASSDFEALEARSGYWVANQGSSAFDIVSIAEGATLDVRETTVGAIASSAIVTGAVANDGLLILNFNSDELADIDALDIYGRGDVRLDGEAAFVIDSATMAFTGTAQVANGSLTLTGEGGLSGDVETSGEGTFVLGNGGATGAFEGDLVNNGRFVFNRTDNYSFLGDFSGTGAFTKMGGGALTFAGDYSYTGTTSIMGGSIRFLGQIDPETDLDLQDGTFDISGTPQTIATLSGSGNSEINVDESQLTVNQDENTTYAGSITGDGELVKTGDGLLNLTGNSTYTGPTVINGGAVAVNGSIVSAVTVNTGILMGSGTVGGATIGSDGTLAPGNSIGTLNVNGDIRFAAGSVYEVEVNAAGASDQILATGEAVIEGGTVEVLAEAGTYRPFTEYLIIGAQAGVDGEFDEVTSNFAFLTPTLTYGANEVRLQLLRNDIRFADVAQTGNQTSVGTALESLEVRDQLYTDIALLTEASARQAFDALSGEAYASFGSNLVADGRQIVDAVLASGRELRGTGAWARAIGDWSDFDAAPGTTGLEGDQQGVVGGINFGQDGFTFGGAVGASKSDYRASGRAGSAEVDTTMAAVHAGYGAGPVNARVGGSYSWHDVGARRSVEFPGVSESMSASYDARTTQLFGEIGYAVPAGGMTVEPFGRFEHVRVKTDGFGENGGTTALAVNEEVRKVQFGSLGLRATGTVIASPGMTLEPSLSAAWRHGWGDLEGRATAAFDGSDRFEVTGVRLPKDALDLNLGAALRTGSVRVGVSYRGMLSSRWDSHGAEASVSFAF